MNDARDVLVFLEPFGENSEQLNRGLLTEGRRIASQLGIGLSAIVLGTLPQKQGVLEAHGVSSLYLVEGTGLSEYNCEAFVWAAKTALKDISFRLLLFAHSDMGGELATRVAPHLGASAVVDCVDIRVRDGNLYYVKSVYAGQFEQEVSFSEPLSEIAAIRPDVLDIKEAPSSAPLNTIRIPVKIPPGAVNMRRLEITPLDSRTVDILYSERIVGAGYGCTEPGLLGLVEELSELLRGSIGTTRPVVDDGYIPRMRMIGQTGKTVTPELYLALGISGSPHHLAGIQQSKKVLSVNRDPQAPIFNFSDAGYVSDLKILLPKLIDRIKRYQSENPA